MNSKTMSFSIDSKYLPSTTIMPRLDHSMVLLEDVISRLQKNHHLLRRENTSISESPSPEDLARIEIEKKIHFSLELLLKIQQKIFSINNIATAPAVITPLTPVIRTISSQLHSILPDCSQKLSELSIYLGSICLDSAALLDASIDFGKSNLESKFFLDEVKLIVDSKISKLYPNLDFN